MERDIVLQKVTPIKPNFMGSQPITVYAPNVNNPINGLKDADGSGSIQQTGYTQEGIYEDFKHYTAAYGIAMAQGLDSVEAIEQLMDSYTYEQLLIMIAQANFGGNTEQAQAYLYGMIDQALADNNLEFLPNKVNGPVSTALGAGNIVWPPGSFVSGYNNIVGRKGYPFQAAFSVTTGFNNINNGMNAIVSGLYVANNGMNAIVVGEGDKENGKPLINNGKRSIVAGNVAFKQTAEIVNALDRESSNRFKSRLAELGLITTAERDDDNFKWWYDGNHSDSSNICIESYIHEDAGAGNVAISQSVIAPCGTVDGRTTTSGNNFAFGWWNILSGRDNAAFGPSNEILNSFGNFAAGAFNTIEDEYINGFNNNSTLGWHNTILSCVDSTAIGYANGIKNKNSAFVAGSNLKAESGSFSWGNIPRSRLGRYNEDIVTNVFEFGIGTEENRKNGMWLDESGNFGVAGGLKVGKALTVENTVVTPSVFLGTRNGTNYSVSNERATLPSTFVDELYIENPTESHDNYAATIGQVKNMVANAGGGGTKLYKHYITFYGDGSTASLTSQTCYIISTSSTRVTAGAFATNAITREQIAAVVDNVISVFYGANMGMTVGNSLEDDGTIDIYYMQGTTRIYFYAEGVTAADVTEL